MAFLDDCIGHWKLGEASGTRADSFTGAANPLTPVNAPGNTAGVIGNAVACVRASNQYLARVDVAGVSCGADTPWTIAGWFKFDSVGNNMGLFLKAGPFTSYTRWCFGIGLNGADSKVYARAANGTTYGEVAWGTALSTGTWYFIVAWHDPTADVVGISVDDGSPVTSAWAGGTYDNTYSVTLGNAVGGTSTTAFDGAADSVWLFFRVLTATEITALFNGGAGLDYPGVVTSTPVNSDRQAIWNDLAAVGDERQAIWNLDGTVGLSRQAIWDVLSTLTAVGAERQAVWNARAPVGLSRQAFWDLLVATIIPTPGVSQLLPFFQFQSPRRTGDSISMFASPVRTGGVNSTFASPPRVGGLISTFSSPSRRG